MLAWTQSDIVMIEPRIMWSVRLLNSSDHDYDTSEAPGYLPIVFPRDNDSLALEEPGDPEPDQASSEALLKSLFLGLERSSTFLSFSSGPSIGLAVVLLILAILGLLLNLLFLVYAVKGLEPGELMSSVQTTCVSVCLTDLLSTCLLLHLLVWLLVTYAPAPAWVCHTIPPTICLSAIISVPSHATLSFMYLAKSKYFRRVDYEKINLGLRTFLMLSFFFSLIFSFTNFAMDLSHSEVCDVRMLARVIRIPGLLYLASVLVTLLTLIGVSIAACGCQCRKDNNVSGVNVMSFIFCDFKFCF